MSYINHIWDYPTMENCAKKLDTLKEASDANKIKMDNAFELLNTAMIDTEVGRAFIASYLENVPSIVLFSQMLESESLLLRSNSNAMQEADAEIATNIRQMFIR